MVRLAHFKVMYNKMRSFLVIPNFPPYGNILPRWVPADQVTTTADRERGDEEDLATDDDDEDTAESAVTESLMIKKRGLPRVSFAFKVVNLTLVPTQCSI